MTEKKRPGRPPKIQSETNNDTNDLNDYIKELSSLQDYITSYSSGSGLTDISLKDLYEMLRNPYSNIFRIQSTSRYFGNRYGIVKDVTEMFRNLPTLNYHLAWSNFDNPNRIKKYEKKIYDVLDSLDIKKAIRDGLGEVAEIGTVVCVNRNSKYLQFLDISNLRINKQVNGKWVVEFDLSTINNLQYQDKISMIESLPDEVSIAKYNLYKTKGTEENRYVVLENAYVLNNRGVRNYPYGLPYTLPAWGSLIHQSLIQSVEKSVSDRLIKSILVLYASSIGADKDPYKAPNKDIVKMYFQDVANLLKKKDQGNYNNSTESAGTGVVALPDFLHLEGVKLETELFPKEFYQKLENDILANLGVSSSLVYGASTSNYGSASLNSEKIFRYIFSALEQWETMINDIIKNLLPSDLDCKFFFDKTTITDKDKDILAKKDLYMQTGIASPWLEAVLGIPYTYAIGMAEYEKKVLKLNDILSPPLNAYTSSGEDKGGAPIKDTPNSNNDKAKGSNSNSIPSPSD